MIGAVDWHLLLMFTCLFGVTQAFSRTGLAQQGLAWLGQQGLYPDHISLMAPVTVVASNTIGNVPLLSCSSSFCQILVRAHFLALQCFQPLPEIFCLPARSATSLWPNAPPFRLR